MRKRGTIRAQSKPAQQRTDDDTDGVRQPVVGGTGPAQRRDQRLIASTAADSPLAATPTSIGRRVATEASSTGATKSTTFAASSTRPTVGIDQATSQRTESCRFTGTKVSIATGRSVTAASHRAIHGRAVNPHPTNGPNRMSRQCGSVTARGVRPGPWRSQAVRR